MPKETKHVWIFIVSIYHLLTIQIVSTSDDTLTLKSVIGRPLVIKCRRNSLVDVKDIKLQWSKDMFGLETSTLTEVYKNRLFVPTQPDSGIFDLHFKSTEADDQGLFGCHIDITFRNGTMVNIVEKIYLKIIIPPSYLEIKPKITNTESLNTLWLPNERTIWGLQNQNLALKCSSGESTPPVKLLWVMMSDYNRQEISNLQSDGNAAVKLSQKHQNSVASCSIRNKEDYPGCDLPIVNYTIRVLYFSKPEVTSEDGKFDGKIREDEFVTFTCKTTAPKEANVYYNWYIQHSRLNSKIYLVNDSTSNSITLKMSQKYHRGRLHCIIRGSIKQNDCDKQTNRNCELELIKDVEEARSFNIMYPPKIASPFENVTVTNIGEWVTLTCNVDSNPSVVVKWYKTHIGTTKNARSINWYHQTEISNLIESLRIENIVISGSYHKFQILNDQDFDIYICEAKSAMFGSAYKYVVVAREEEISLKTDRSVIKIQEGGSASLMCLVEGWPRPLPGSIRWHHTDIDTPLIFNERIHVVNKNQLMALESKLYFKNVINSDYGSYNCTVSYGDRKISKKLDLQPIKDPLLVFILIGVIGISFVIITVTVIACISKKLYNHKMKKSKKVNSSEYSGPIQTTVLTSPTIDSCIENEMLFSRLNSLPSFHKDNSFNESINMPSNRCFIFNNKHQISRLPSGDSRNGHDDSSNSKGNGSNRSWDSGVGPDDAIYRNGQMIPNTRGSRCISPFSTLASSNNSIGPVNQNHIINNRYFTPMTPFDIINQQNAETGSNRYSNNDQGSNFNGSNNSSFLPSNLDGSGPMIASTGNQSFVCIPIEEYQQHIRLLQESRGQPSINSLSSASFPPNNEGSTFNHNFKMFNGEMTPTENSVKSISVNSKP